MYKLTFFFISFSKACAYLKYERNVTFEMPTSVVLRNKKKAYTLPTTCM